MILSTLLTVFLSAVNPCVVQDTTETEINAAIGLKNTTLVEDRGYWKKKKYNRISYNQTLFSPLFIDEPYPVKMSIGLDSGRNIYLHKKPLAGIIKFGIDVGMDINYTMLDLKIDTSDYEGPSGYLGSSPAEEAEDMLMIPGSHYASVGLAVGPSVTVNPVDKLRLCGYFHVVPSATCFLHGMGAFVGYSTAMKYGLEVSYGPIGVGVEHNSGLEKYMNVLQYYVMKVDGGDVSGIGRPKYFSESLQVYLSFRFGKK